jgi:hypothetical protein
VNAIVRLVLAIVAFIATYFFTYWLPFAFLPESVPSLVAPLGAVVLGALITGAIGFCGGFFGPLIFTPGANQGPLLGLFITGPLGFVLGGIGGGIYWAARGRQQ